MNIPTSFSTSCLSLIVCLLAFTSCDLIPPTVPPTTEAGVLWNLKYGPKDRNRLDISLPADRDAATPVIILIHGGAWIIGDKLSMTQARERLANEGFAVVAMNYSYVSQPQTDYLDLMAEIDSVVSFLADSASVWTFDPENIGLAGISAGAHMSLLYAYGYDPDERVKAVGSIVGPVDLTDDFYHSGTFAQQEFLVYGGLVQLVDTSFAAYPAAYEDASPIFRLKDVPTQLFYGRTDHLVNYQQAFRMDSVLTEEGIDHEFHFFEDAGHNLVNMYPDSVYSELTSWFTSYLMN
ncbi:MAG: alpha/beta hydrolase [Bacteroidota bacterium]